MVLVAVNKEHGGFSISQEVVDILKENNIKMDLSGQEDSSFFPISEYGYFVHNKTFFIESDNYHECRTFFPLIEAIRKAKNPNGKLSHIEIVEIPDDIKWYIDDYDGFEIVREEHRTW